MERNLLFKLFDFLTYIVNFDHNLRRSLNAKRCGPLLQFVQSPSFNIDQIFATLRTVPLTFQLDYLLAKIFNF